jgi:hypothetical protein
MRGPPVSAVGHAPPQRRNLAAEKARKQKLIAAGAIAVLAIVLAFQLPRTLKALHSSGNSTPAPAAPSPAATPAAAPAPAASPAEQKPSRELQALLSGRVVDPFASRGASSVDPAPRPIAAPAGMRDPFAHGGTSSLDAPVRDVSAPPGLRDPFVRPSASVPSESIKQIVVGSGTGKPTIGYIVVLASIPLNEGRGAAVQFAHRATAAGIKGVAILNSSSRKPLRHGYWVVYIGSWKSVLTAINAASAVHGVPGYGGSYVRQLVRYG